MFVSVLDERVFGVEVFSGGKTAGSRVCRVFVFLVRSVGVRRSVFGGFLKGSMAVATLGAKCSDMKVFRGSVKGVKGFGS